jgi:hypothetical protein
MPGMAYQLAQINVARFLLPPAHEANRDFTDNLARVNTLAEQQPGFVWRLVGEAPDAHVFGDPNLAINLSVWADMAALAEFVYHHPAHRDIMRRRREWFDKLQFSMALWWVPAGHRPTVTEGKAAIDRIAQAGSTAGAFLFNRPFPSPDGAVSTPVAAECP